MTTTKNRGIPSMTAHAIRPQLQAAVRQMTPSHAIVEIGTWLGAGAFYMGQIALPETPIWCYDRFTATASEVKKAAAYDFKLDVGQDTRSIVSRHVLPVHSNLFLVKSEIRGARWCGDPIDIYVDDAGKQLPDVLHKLRVFGPSWVPGRTLVFLLDLYYYRRRRDQSLRCQQNFVDRFPSVLKMQQDLDPHGAVFRYQRPFDFFQLQEADLR